MARRIARRMRDTAYDASVDLARERGAFPLFNADLYLSGSTFASRLPQPLKDRIRAARPAQFAPAVDRAHRHHQPGLRRQRQQRHRARLQLDLHAQEAPARRRLRRARGAGPRLAPVQAPEGRRRAADAGLRDGAGDERAGPRRDGGRGGAVHRHRDQQDRQRAGRLPAMPISRTSTTQAWSLGLKGLATYRPNAVRRQRAAARRRSRRRR